MKTKYQKTSDAVEAVERRIGEVEIFCFGSLLKDMSALALNQAFVRAWDCNEGEQMRMIRAERKRRGYPI